MENKFQSKTYPQGSRTLWRYLGALFILFTFAIGNVFAVDPTHDAPATVTTGGKTYIDAANTPGNAGDDAYINYGVMKMDSKKDDWAWFEYGGTWSKSNSSYSLPTGAVGFCTPGSNSSSEFYGKVNFNTNSKTTSITIYFTGTTEVGFIWKNNNTSNNRWIVYTLQELKASDGTNVGDPSVFDTHTSTSAQYNKFTSLDGTKYYKLVMSTAGASSSEFYGFTLKKYVAPATKYTVTYKAGEGTGDDVVDSDAKTVKAFADCSFTAPSGYEFKEWQDAGSNVVAAGATVSADMTLTAIYRLIPTKYTVEYILNGPSGDAPTETSKAKDDVFTLAAAPSWAGHAFDGWLCSADAAVKAAGSSYTMTAANTTFTAQWHELDCKIYSLTGGIGSAEIVADESNAEVNANSLVLKGSNAIIKLTPASGTFKAGDVFTISGTVGNTSKNFGVKISASANKGSGLGLASVSGTTNPMIATATLSADADYLYICRDGSTTQTLKTVEVHRSCAEGAAAGLSYATAEVEKTLGDAKFTNALTNTNGLVLAGYKSSDASVATVDFSTGEVTIVGAGSATITANSAVQTKAGTLYAAGTASYTLTVTCTAPRTPAFADVDPIVVTHNSATATWDVMGYDVSIANYQVSVVKKSDASVVLDWTTVGFAAPAPSYTATGLDPETGYTFKIRTVGASDYCEYSPVVTEDFTTTAEPADSYTVIFKDGTTELAIQQFGVGTYPSDAGVSKTKPLFTFAAWQKEGVDIALNDAFWATVAANAEVTLTARWAKTYANSVDFVQKITDDGTSGWKAYLEANKYYISSESGVSFDNSNAFDTGLKMKDNTSNTLSFRAAPGKVIDLTVGKINGMTIAINGGAASALTSGTDATHLGVSHYYAAGEQEVVLAETATGYNIIRKITIRDPYEVSFEAHGDADPSALQGLPSVTLPDASNGTASLLGWFDAETGGNKIGDAGDTYIPTANITLHAQWESVSTDARLASITFSSDAGTLEPAFDPEVTNYTYTMPYGTAAVPTITGATSVNANAKAPVIDAQAANWNDVAHIHGVAESDDTKDYYITMKIAPKDPTCLVWADIPSANTLTFNASKSLWNEEDVTLAINGVSGKDGSAPSGVKFQKPGYIKIQKNEGSFQIGDIVALDVTYLSGSTMHVFKVQEPSTAADVIGTGTTATTPAGVNKVAITEDAATLWLARPNNESAYKDWNPHVDYVAVYRAMNPVLKSITFAGVEATVNEAGKTVTVTVPYATNLGTMVVVPTIFRNAPHATTPEAVITNEGAWVEGSGNTYRIMDKDGDYTDYAVTITRAAVSHDATLSELTVDGNAIALENDVYTYAYEYEQGTAVSPAPVVAATAHDANAKSVVITQASDKTGTATVVVTAEDNTTTKTYTINFSISTKIKVVIFDGNDDKATAIKTSPHATGASWVVTGLSADDDDKGTSYTTKIATGGSTGSSKNIAVTIPVNYQPFFELAQASNKNENERKAFITTTANGSGTKLYELANSVTNTPSKGMSTGLTEETTYYIHSDNSINFYEVNLYLLPLDPKAATPTLSGLVDLAACTLGTDELTVTASDLDGGTAHYQWYKVVEGDDPDEAVGTDANTYAPTVAGKYYVVVTNQKADHRDNSVKSDEVTVSVKAATEITGYINANGAAGATGKQISVTAIGAGTLHYVWYTCDDEIGTNPVAVDPANDAAILSGITIPSGIQYYKVVVTGECGSAEQILFAKEWADVELQDVTGSMTWNLHKTENPDAWTGIDGDITVSSTSVLANVNYGQIPNNANFRSDMLKLVVGTVETKIRKGTDNGVIQGNEIMFHTTVPGMVRVTYRGTGSGANVTLTIGSETLPTYHGSMTTSKKVFVPAGDVVISSGSDAFRIQKIEFNATPDYTRTGLTVGKYGTTCLPSNVPAGAIFGAEVYKLLYWKYGTSYADCQMVEFEQVEAMNAGEPYLILPTEETFAVFYGDITVADPQTMSNGFIGTFDEIVAAPDNVLVGKYGIVNNMVQKLGENCHSAPNRAYIDLSMTPSQSDYESTHPKTSTHPKRLSLGHKSPQITTGLDAINVDAEGIQKVLVNGQLYIVRGGQIYTATGQLVK